EEKWWQLGEAVRRRAVTNGIWEVEVSFARITAASRSDLSFGMRNTQHRHGRRGKQSSSPSAPDTRNQRIHGANSGHLLKGWLGWRDKQSPAALVVPDNDSGHRQPEWLRWPFRLPSA